MPRSFLRAACAVLLAVVAACSDTSAPENPVVAVRGTVRDAAGTPVVGAAVVLDLDFALEPGPAADKPATEIRFALPEAGPYTLLITDACDDEIFHTVTDTAGGPGVVAVVWDGRDDEGRSLVEGFYRCHLLVAGHEPLARDLVLARNLGDAPGDFGLAESITVRATWRVAAWTDEDGRFRIARRCWEFGRSTDYRDESGVDLGTVTVAPRVRVWAYPADRPLGTASGWVDFDPVTGATASIELAETTGLRDRH